MALIRARFLSLDLMVIHGAWSESVCRNVRSFASVYSSQRSSDARSMGESFQRRTGSIWRMAKRVRCSCRVTENQNLVTWMPASTSIFSKTGAWPTKVSYSSSVQNPHDAFHIGAVVPGAVEHDDFTRSGKVLDVALEIPLALLTVRGLGERYRPGRAGIQMLGETLDSATLAGGVASLEDNDVLQTEVLPPQYWNFNSSICRRYFSISYSSRVIRCSYG